MSGKCKMEEEMAGLELVRKTRDYCDYLEDHLRNVARAFMYLSSACAGMAWVSDDYVWWSLREQVLNHDVSKFSVEEFVQYRRKFFPADGQDADRAEVEAGFMEAWENHKRLNPHHHESAYCYADIVHMVVDWTAMGYKFGDTAQTYYEKNKEKISLTPQNEAFLSEIFDHIARYTVEVGVLR